MFGWDQRQRLLRERWTDPNELAEEIFAMISPDAPNRTESPMVIDLPQAARAAGIAPLQVTGEESQPVIQIIRNNGTSGGIVSISGGSFYFQSTPQSTPKAMAGAGGSGGSAVPVWG